jgi:DHA2 family multidrug resistance protein
MPEGSPTSKWLVTIAVMFGTFLSVMDVTVVNVAMPHMMGAFGVNLLTITWVSTAYSIAEIITVTMSAWWSTVLGRKRLFLFSMVLFIIGSILAGTAQSFGQILLYRVIQGAGGGSLIPVAQAILRESFPPAEQGMALAVYTMGVVLAPAIGPVLGGWLIDRYDWRWVFYINVPFCIAGITMVSVFVRDPSYLKRGIKHVDCSHTTNPVRATTAIAIPSTLQCEANQSTCWPRSSTTWVVASPMVSNAIPPGYRAPAASSGH